MGKQLRSRRAHRHHLELVSSEEEWPDDLFPLLQHGTRRHARPGVAVADARSARVPRGAGARQGRWRRHAAAVARGRADRAGPARAGASPHAPPGPRHRRGRGRRRSRWSCSVCGRPSPARRPRSPAPAPASRSWSPPPAAPSPRRPSPMPPPSPRRRPSPCRTWCCRPRSPLPSPSTARHHGRPGDHGRRPADVGQGRRRRRPSRRARRRARPGAGHHGRPRRRRRPRATSCSPTTPPPTPAGSASPTSPRGRPRPSWSRPAGPTPVPPANLLQYWAARDAWNACADPFFQRGWGAARVASACGAEPQRSDFGVPPNPYSKSQA